MEDGGFIFNNDFLRLSWKKRETCHPDCQARLAGFARSPGSVRARIFVRRWRLPAGQRALGRPVDLDLERIAFGSIVGVTGATVAARTGREPNQQIKLG